MFFRFFIHSMSIRIVNSTDPGQTASLGAVWSGSALFPYQVKRIQRGSFMVWEINMGVCPRLEFDNIMFINCLGYDFYIYGAFEFLCNSIANLWRHVWYHYNALGYPVKIISKVIDISCNGRRNVLLNNYIIDKFVDIINGFVCIRIVGGHSFLWDGTPIFNCIFSI